MDYPSGKFGDCIVSSVYELRSNGQTDKQTCTVLNGF